MFTLHMGRARLVAEGHRKTGLIQFLADVRRPTLRGCPLSYAAARSGAMRLARTALRR